VNGTSIAVMVVGEEPALALNGRRGPVILKLTLLLDASRYRGSRLMRQSRVGTEGPFFSLTRTGV